MVRLDRLIDSWEPERSLMFCDEALAGEKGDLASAQPGPWAILIGPEGGFSVTERKRLHGLEWTRPVALGPRILRADTAAVAAMTLWQKTLGDWT
jgi:16S rRNA (uracil1498-N3)-methyltransferase